jgi:ABC-type Fe3+ transport system substrate-binding protein
VRAGLSVAFESPFTDRFPAGWTDPAGQWLPLYVQPIVGIYNGHRASPPRSWRDLADRSEPGRLVFDDPARMLTTGPALAELLATFGEAGWEAFVRSLADRTPGLVADNERAVLEVATGSRWTGLSNWNVARRVRPGSPVRHVFLAPTPCVPGFGVLIKDSPAPSLARLFLAWLGSERGQQAYAATGRIPARPDVGGWPSLSTVLPTGVEPVFGSSDWLADPDRWADRYRELLPADRATAAEGKLR